MVKFRKARYNELGNIARVVTDSFREYPLFTLTNVDNNKKQELFYEINLVNVKVHYKKHSCLVGCIDDEIVAVALLQHKGRRRPNLFDFIGAGGIKIIFSKGVTAALNLLKVLDVFTDGVENMEDPHWYLDTIVIAKKYQHMNLGSDMLNRCITPYIKKRGGGVLALITNTDPNRKFYKKNGFKQFDETNIKMDDGILENYSFIKLI